MNTENALVLTSLLLQYAIKTQAIAELFARASAEGRDVTDEEIAASGLAADAALARLEVATR